MRRLVVAAGILGSFSLLVAACATGLIANVGGSDAGVEGGSDASACPEFDLQTDPKHCGSCTNACSSGQLCTLGKCKAQCDSPTVKCNGDAGPLCVNVAADPKNCGQCGTVCPTADAGSLPQGTGNDSGLPPDAGYDGGTGWVLGTPTCSNSTCSTSCPSGTTICSDNICYDVQNHHDHCGSCTTACASGEWCTSGKCCQPGQLVCNNACTDVLTSAANCGKCGNVCSGGTPFCNNGTCTIGCNPSGTRQPFNTFVSATTTGCWNTGNPCGQDTSTFSQTYGRNFQANGQEVVCGGVTACVGHVGIGTYTGSTTVCQGAWDVYCNNTKVGTINTVGKTCGGTAMTNGCSIAFTPASCSTIKLVASAGNGGLGCCGGAMPDSMIVAVSAW